MITDLGDNLVLLDSRSGEMFALNETGRVLWEATGVPLTPRARDGAAQHIARLAQTMDLGQLTLGTGALPEPDTLLA